ncbi:hypothetical protein D9M69_640440 [compost metagenome]
MGGYIELLARDLAADGLDAAALREGVRPTDAAAGLLGRFARIVEAKAQPAA